MPLKCISLTSLSLVEVHVVGDKILEWTRWRVTTLLPNILTLGPGRVNIICVCSIRQYSNHYISEFRITVRIKRLKVVPSCWDGTNNMDEIRRTTPTPALIFNWLETRLSMLYLDLIPFWNHARKLFNYTSTEELKVGKIYLKCVKRDSWGVFDSLL